MGVRRRTSKESKESILRELAESGWTTRRMGQYLGLRRNTVSQYLRELGIPYVRYSRELRTGHRVVIPLIDELRKERMLAKLSLTEFSKRTGWDRTLIGEWETGKRRIHGPGLIDYANALGFDVTLTMRAP